jgi:succinate dehydrogenase / fumarate reductase, membrane anchor subunit
MPLSYHTSGKSGSFSWLFMRVSGLALVVLVIVHYFLMHIDPDRGHTFEAVHATLTHPVWGPWFKTLDLTMLALGLWHGLTGTWGIMRDYALSPTWRVITSGILLIAGISFGIMGFTTILSF